MHMITNCRESVPGQAGGNAEVLARPNRIKVKGIQVICTEDSEGHILLPEGNFLLESVYGKQNFISTTWEEVLSKHEHMFLPVCFLSSNIGPPSPVFNQKISFF